ncbi:MAG: hypothetical protein KGQ16_03535 [Cyanobacteria bacterium REEB444]|nr:hypothetical protein [Cyanobacteria bacterium REEB444]
MKTIPYSSATVNRAVRAIKCTPFRQSLFEAMGRQSIALLGIAGPAGVQSGYTRSLLSQRQAERSLLWLIQVGVLRREVDGQGITDSFRLTPLGRYLADQSPTWTAHSWLDWLLDQRDRWLNFSFN